jgi:hypothetical protein
VVSIDDDEGDGEPSGAGGGPGAFSAAFTLAARVRLHHLLLSGVNSATADPPGQAALLAALQRAPPPLAAAAQCLPLVSAAAALAADPPAGADAPSDLAAGMEVSPAAALLPAAIVRNPLPLRPRGARAHARSRA